MAVHNSSAASDKKLGVALDDMSFFNGENMQNNAKIIYYSRTFLSIIGGVSAGILGLTGISGFIFYVLVMAVTSGGLAAKAKLSVNSYFDSWNKVLFDGFLGGLMSFVLFWTLHGCSSYGHLHDWLNGFCHFVVFCKTHTVIALIGEKKLSGTVNP